MEMPMITTANFEEKVMQSSKPVLMIFSAPWCGYCKRLKPALMQLAGEIMEQVAIGGVNIDDDPALATKFEIETIPTLILAQDGKFSEQLVNPPSKAAIKEWLQGKGVI